MNKVCGFAALVATGLTLSPSIAFAQAPADQTAGSTASQATVPLDQQASRAQLDNLFEVMRVRNQMAAMTKTMPQVMQNAFSEQFKQMEKDHPEITPTTDAQKQAVSKIMGKHMERAMSLYPADEMVEDMASLYQKHLSRSDVDAMIGFYSSPAGQHMLDMVPVIMQEYMPMVMKKMQERIQPAIDEMAKEMNEALKPKAPAADQPAPN